MFCRKCGAQLREDDIFCSKCGVCVAPTDDNIEVTHEDSVLDLSQLNKKTAPKNKKIIIGVCIAAAVVLISVVIAAIIYFSGNTGDKYFAAGNYEQAADEFEDILEKDAENTEVRIKLAKAYLELGEYDDAIEALDYVFRYDNGNAEVYELLLTACAGEHEDSLANDYYDEANFNDISVNLKKTGYSLVPDLVDLSFDKAAETDDANIVEKERIDDDSDEGTIIEQSPEAGAIGRLTGGKMKIYVTVSDGPGESVMKDYKGTTLDELKTDIGDNHLIETEDEGSNTVEKGKVIRTIPAAGETLKKDAVVTVYISSGEKIVSVPKITGKTLEQANDILDNVDLGIGSVTYESSGKAQGTVISQSPAHKTKVNADTYVDVVISSGE